MADIHEPDTPRNRGDHDAPHLSPATPADDMRTILLNRVSWGAVLAGVVVSLVTQLILNLLGIGLGAATLDPAAGAAGNPSATGFSIGAGLWWAISGILAALVGGYTAGRLAGRPQESTAGWHGLTAWAFTTLLIFYLLTSTLGGIIGGAYRTVADAAGGITSAAGSTMQTAASQMTDPFTAIERSVRGASGGNDPAALREMAVTAIRAAVTGDQGQAQDARERAAQALAQAQGVPVDQARSQVQQYEQQYREAADTARRQATAAADVAAQAVSTGALFGAIALLLGALAAWFGGRMGAIEPTLTAPFGFGAAARRHKTA
jgi:hypothetical protein